MQLACSVHQNLSVTGQVGAMSDIAETHAGCALLPDHARLADPTIADVGEIKKFLVGTCDDVLACTHTFTDTALTCDATPAD